MKFAKESKLYPKPGNRNILLALALVRNMNKRG